MSSDQRVAQGQGGLAERRQTVWEDRKVALTDSGTQQAQAAVADHEGCQRLVRALDEMGLPCISESAGATASVVEQGGDDLGHGMRDGQVNRPDEPRRALFDALPHIGPAVTVSGWLESLFRHGDSWEHLITVESPRRHQPG